MSRDDIIAMAHEAGIWMPMGTEKSAAEDALERFAALAAAAEREACAQIAQATVCDTHIPTGIKIYGTRAAQAIRARGKP